MVERLGPQQEPNRGPAELGFEKRLMESEPVSSRRVTLREVLDRKGRDPVGILDIQATLQVRDLPESTIYSVSFPENQASFGGEKFIEVLSAAKPIRRGGIFRSQDKNGIIADWRMLKEDIRSQSNSYDNLHRKHTASTWPLTRKLGEHFEEIGENHFSRFWDAINSEYLVESRWLALGDVRMEGGIEVFLRTIDKDKLELRNAFVKFLKRKTNLEISDDFGDYFSFYTNKNTLFGTFTSEKKEELIIDFCNELKDGILRKLGDLRPDRQAEIAPLIIWETDKTTGKRKYFCGKISAELIEAFPDLFFERQDTYFGQIAVAAYSDNLKSSLPAELPLKKGGQKQNMLEAQMLAYPKLFAGAYLKSSPVILGLEALPRKR